MGESDKLFNGFLRLVIRRLKDAIEENDPDKKQAILMYLLSDLQATLED